MLNPIVIKIGGHEIADNLFLKQLAELVSQMNQPIAIVHGGGSEISMMQQKLGIEPYYIDGIRVTDADSLAVVTMVLCGTINKRLVRVLTASGLDAQGMSGVDRNIVRAARMIHASVDMGYTGQVAHVRGDILNEIVSSGIIPVIAPICAGEDSLYNVNADHVAGAVAAAMGAERIVFITNVEGVLVDNAVTLSLTESEANRLIADGVIHGGMIPKVKTALESLDSGVPRAVITNLTGLRTHGGTVFTSD